ncbi:TetR/AcrR family transcriptional regulator [Thermomonas fusca]
MSQRPRPLPADERRAATVDAVVELAAEQNPGDITTAAIAQRMGLTQGALFRHFPTKDAILESVLGWVSERLLGQLDAAAASAATPLAALEAMFMAHVDFVSRHPGVPRMLFGELQRPGDTLPKRMAQTLTQGYAQRLRAHLAAGIARQQLDAGLDLDAAATLFIGTVQGLVMQSLIAGDVARIRRDAPGVFAIYCRGIRSQP